MDILQQGLSDIREICISRELLLIYALALKSPSSTTYLLNHQVIWAVGMLKTNSIKAITGNNDVQLKNEPSTQHIHIIDNTRSYP